MCECSDVLPDGGGFVMLGTLVDFRMSDDKDVENGLLSRGEYRIRSRDRQR